MSISTSLLPASTTPSPQVRPQSFLTSFKGRIVRNICSVGSTLYNLAMKVARFFQRYSQAIGLYVGLAVAMKLFRVSNQDIAKYLFPGFGWNLVFSNGRVLPTDFLERVSPTSSGTTWLPDSIEEEGALKTRCETLDRAMHHLSVPPTADNNQWVLLHGPTGVGKTAALEVLAKRLAAQGRDVFVLNTSVLRAGQLNGLLDTRFLEIVLYLNGIKAQTGRYPILVADEIHRLINPQSPGFNDVLKDGNILPLHFHVLGATTENVATLDPAFANRFHGHTLKVEALDEPGMKAVIQEVCERRFSRVEGENATVAISSDVIAHAIEKSSSLDGHLRLKRVLTILSNACQEIRMHDRTATQVTLSTSDIDSAAGRLSD